MHDDLPDPQEAGTQFRQLSPDGPPTNTLLRGKSVMPPTEASEPSNSILVCAGNCSVYYEYHDAWEYCPQCAEPLDELQSAEE